MKGAEFETRRSWGPDEEVEAVDCCGQSYLEKNCNQIFVKGPALTKEILEKMNADLVPRETYLFGYGCKTKRVLCTSGFTILFILSVIGFSTIWFTNPIENYAFSQMVTVDDPTNENFLFWKKPTVTPHVHVYLFNYTNVYEYTNGIDKKLHVQEVGPYVYREFWEKVNLVFNEDDTVSYQDRRDYTFMPELSKGKQSDQIVALNIPLLSGSAALKDQNYFARLAFSGVLSGLDEKPFLTLPADKFIMGYDDTLYEFSKNLNQFNNRPSPEKFGLFALKQGVQPNVYTVNTGAKDINKLGLLEKINGKAELDMYSTKSCNSINASADGSYYPPRAARGGDDLFYFFPQLCRRMPLVFEKETTIFDGKVPAFQYTQPDDVFDAPEDKPENQCFCSSAGLCPPKGLFNVTDCSMGAPMFISRPHFQGADPAVQQVVTGLEPGRDFKIKAMIHPKMSFMMAGRANLQVNVQVQKAYGVSQMDVFEEGDVLPIAWIDVLLEEQYLPQNYVDIINMVTFMLPRTRMAFEYGSLFATFITFAFLVATIVRNRRSRPEIAAHNLL